MDTESFTQHLSTRQPPLWFIDIALKLGAQLSISITIFQVFGMTRLWIELTTFRSVASTLPTLPVVFLGSAKLAKILEKND